MDPETLVDQAIETIEGALLDIAPPVLALAAMVYALILAWRFGRSFFGPDVSHHSSVRENLIPGWDRDPRDRR